MTARPEIRIANPAWVEDVIDAAAIYPDDASRMRVAIRLAHDNVLHETGGPFGAAVFESASGRLVGVGVNLVVPLDNCALHAEVVAFMMAQTRVGSYTLAAPGMADHALYTSCEPCAMCLGATQWSGVKRVVFAATREDASELFDEGPVFPASYDYLEARGIRFTGGILRAEARATLELYRDRQGERYNG
ncbi:MAG: nucleoside deaminase [Longimicrobiales bacterium]